MKRVRRLAQYKCSMGDGHSDLTRNTIRNKDYVVEEISLYPALLDNAELLDDTLRSVRSCKFESFDKTASDLLARSFKRTKDGNQLERVIIIFPTLSRLGFRVAQPMFQPMVQTIIRSRPNLQVLNLQKIPSDDFVPLCKTVAASTLTAFICDLGDLSEMRVEGAVDIVGKLVQHSTIRDFQLDIGYYSTDCGCEENCFVQGVAESLRATRLRRFHLTMSSYDGASIASMTKLYESVRENRSLMDIQLKGTFWNPWRKWRHDVSDTHPPPCPFSFFEFLSSRNQYLSLLLMPYEYTLPAGLWPLMLESASCDASILYYLLTFQPHLVKG